MNIIYLWDMTCLSTPEIKIQDDHKTSTHATGVQGDRTLSDLDDAARMAAVIVTDKVAVFKAITGKLEGFIGSWAMPG